MPYPTRFRGLPVSGGRRHWSVAVVRISKFERSVLDRRKIATRAHASYVRVTESVTKRV